MADQRRRLFVIGSSGFVGSWVARRATDAWQVSGGSRHPAAGTNDIAIDVGEPESVRAAFDQVRPDAVILTAAMADIDRCQNDQALADRVNFAGPCHVARECAQRGARLVFTSTGAVFDGTRPPYTEADTPTPTSHYGSTKARAEAAIRDILPAAIVLRFSWVLGRALTPGANSYVGKFPETLRAGKPVPAPTFENRNPIDVSTLADVLLTLAGSDARGIFHIGAADKMSRYELARQLAVELGMPEAQNLIQPLAAPTPGRAPRGADDFLACERLPREFGFVVPNCQEVIARAVHGTA